MHINSRFNCPVCGDVVDMYQNRLQKKMYDGSISYVMDASYKLSCSCMKERALEKVKGSEAEKDIQGSVGG